MERFRRSCKNRRARGIGEGRFEEAEIAAAETGDARGADLGNHRRHLTRRKLGDSFYVAPVLVAKRHVRKQVLHREQAFGFEHGTARGSNAFHIGEGSREIHGKFSVQCPQ